MMESTNMNVETTPAQLPGCYLLVILGEPLCENHKEKILQRVAKGLLSWNTEETQCDLKHLEQVCDSLKTSKKASVKTELLLQHSTDKLAVEVLFNPQIFTLKQCLRNLLLSPTGHKHIIHAGYSFTGSGSWILQDGIFRFRDFVDELSDPSVTKVLSLYPAGCALKMHLHCSPTGDWVTNNLDNQAFSHLIHLFLNPPDSPNGVPGASSLLEFIEGSLETLEGEETLEPSPLVGNIRFERPTMYIFPSGQGDCSLFGVTGFTMLIDGGFTRFPCFWKFVRHIERLDSIMITRINESNLWGILSLLRGKQESSLYLKIGYVFCNLVDNNSEETLGAENGGIASIKSDPNDLTVSIIEVGNEIASRLKRIGCNPHQCLRESNPSPLTLYHKVGHGTLEMYILSPPRDSRLWKDFLAHWNSNKDSLPVIRTRSASKAGGQQGQDIAIPIPDVMSICCLLIWKPSNPSDRITRILFPGSAPQSQIMEGLASLKELNLLQQRACTGSSLLQSQRKSTVKSTVRISETSNIRSSSTARKSTSRYRSVSPTMRKTRVPYAKQSSTDHGDKGGDSSESQSSPIRRKLITSTNQQSDASKVGKTAAKESVKKTTSEEKKTVKSVTERKFKSRTSSTTRSSTVSKTDSKASEKASETVETTKTRPITSKKVQSRITSKRISDKESTRKSSGDSKKEIKDSSTTVETGDSDSGDKKTEITEIFSEDDHRDSGKDSEDASPKKLPFLDHLRDEVEPDSLESYEIYGNIEISKDSLEHSEDDVVTGDSRSTSQLDQMISREEDDDDETKSRSSPIQADSDLQSAMISSLSSNVSEMTVISGDKNDDSASDLEVASLTSRINNQMSRSIEISHVEEARRKSNDSSGSFRTLESELKAAFMEDDRHSIGSGSRKSSLLSDATKRHDSVIGEKPESNSGPDSSQEVQSGRRRSSEFAYDSAFQKASIVEKKEEVQIERKSFEAYECQSNEKIGESKVDIDSSTTEERQLSDSKARKSVDLESDIKSDSIILEPRKESIDRFSGEMEMQVDNEENKTASPLKDEFQKESIEVTTSSIKDSKRSSIDKSSDNNVTQESSMKSEIESDKANSGPMIVLGKSNDNANKVEMISKESEIDTKEILSSREDQVRKDSLKSDISETDQKSALDAQRKQSTQEDTKVIEELSQQEDATSELTKPPNEEIESEHVTEESSMTRAEVTRKEASSRGESKTDSLHSSPLVEDDNESSDSRRQSPSIGGTLSETHTKQSILSETQVPHDLEMPDQAKDKNKELGDEIFIVKSESSQLSEANSRKSIESIKSEKSRKESISSIEGKIESVPASPFEKDSNITDISRRESNWIEGQREEPIDTDAAKSEISRKESIGGKIESVPSNPLMKDVNSPVTSRRESHSTDVQRKESIDTDSLKTEKSRKGSISSSATKMDSLPSSPLVKDVDSSIGTRKESHSTEMERKESIDTQSVQSEKERKESVSSIGSKVDSLPSSPLVKDVESSTSSRRESSSTIIRFEKEPDSSKKLDSELITDTKSNQSQIPQVEATTESQEKHDSKTRAGSLSVDELSTSFKSESDSELGAKMDKDDIKSTTDREITWIEKRTSETSQSIPSPKIQSIDDDNKAISSEASIQNKNDDKSTSSVDHSPNKPADLTSNSIGSIDLKEIETIVSQDYEQSEIKLSDELITSSVSQIESSMTELRTTGIESEQSGKGDQEANSRKKSIQKEGQINFSETDDSIQVKNEEDKEICEKDTQRKQSIKDLMLSKHVTEDSSISSPDINKIHDVSIADVLHESSNAAEASRQASTVVSQVVQETQIKGTESVRKDSVSAISEAESTGLEIRKESLIGQNIRSIDAQKTTSDNQTIETGLIAASNIAIKTEDSTTSTSISNQSASDNVLNGNKIAEIDISLHQTKESVKTKELASKKKDDFSPFSTAVSEIERFKDTEDTIKKKNSIVSEDSERRKTSLSTKSSAFISSQEEKTDFDGAFEGLSVVESESNMTQVEGFDLNHQTKSAEEGIKSTDNVLQAEQRNQSIVMSTKDTDSVAMKSDISTSHKEVLESTSMVDDPKSSGISGTNSNEIFVKVGSLEKSEDSVIYTIFQDADNQQKLENILKEEVEISSIKVSVIENDKMDLKKQDSVSSSRKESIGSISDGNEQAAQLHVELKNIDESSEGHLNRSYVMTSEKPENQGIEASMQKDPIKIDRLISSSEIIDNIEFVSQSKNSEEENVIRQGSILSSGDKTELSIHADESKSNQVRDEKDSVEIGMKSSAEVTSDQFEKVCVETSSMKSAVVNLNIKTDEDSSETEDKPEISRKDSISRGESKPESAPTSSEVKNDNKSSDSRRQSQSIGGTLSEMHTQQTILSETQVPYDSGSNDQKNVDLDDGVKYKTNQLTETKHTKPIDNDFIKAEISRKESISSIESRSDSVPSSPFGKDENRSASSRQEINSTEFQLEKSTDTDSIKTEKPRKESVTSSTTKIDSAPPSPVVKDIDSSMSSRQESYSTKMQRNESIDTEFVKSEQLRKESVAPIGSKVDSVPSSSTMTEENKSTNTRGQILTPGATLSDKSEITNAQQMSLFETQLPQDLIPSSFEKDEIVEPYDDSQIKSETGLLSEAKRRESIDSMESRKESISSSVTEIDSIPSIPAMMDVNSSINLRRESTVLFFTECIDTTSNQQHIITTTEVSKDLIESAKGTEDKYATATSSETQNNIEDGAKSGTSQESELQRRKSINTQATALETITKTDQQPVQSEKSDSHSQILQTLKDDANTCSEIEMETASTSIVDDVALTRNEIIATSDKIQTDCVPLSPLVKDVNSSSSKNREIQPKEILSSESTERDFNQQIISSETQVPQDPIISSQEKKSGSMQKSESFSENDKYDNPSLRENCNKKEIENSGQLSSITKTKSLSSSLSSEVTDEHSMVAQSENRYSKSENELQISSKMHGNHVTLVESETSRVSEHRRKPSIDITSSKLTTITTTFIEDEIDSTAKTSPSTVELKTSDSYGSSANEFPSVEFAEHKSIELEQDFESREKSDSIYIESEIKSSDTNRIRKSSLSEKQDPQDLIQTSLTKDESVDEVFTVASETSQLSEAKRKESIDSVKSEKFTKESVERKIDSSPSSPLDEELNMFDRQKRQSTEFQRKESIATDDAKSEKSRKESISSIEGKIESVPASPFEKDSNITDISRRESNWIEGQREEPIDTDAAKSEISRKESIGGKIESVPSNPLMKDVNSPVTSRRESHSTDVQRKESIDTDSLKTEKSRKGSISSSATKMDSLPSSPLVKDVDSSIGTRKESHSTEMERKESIDTQSVQSEKERKESVSSIGSKVDSLPSSPLVKDVESSTSSRRESSSTIIRFEKEPDSSKKLDSELITDTKSNQSQIPQVEATTESQEKHDSKTRAGSLSVDELSTSFKSESDSELGAKMDKDDIKSTTDREITWIEKRTSETSQSIPSPKIQSIDDDNKAISSEASIQNKNDDKSTSSVDHSPNKPADLTSNSIGSIDLKEIETIVSQDYEQSEIKLSDELITSSVSQIESSMTELRTTGIESEQSGKGDQEANSRKKSIQKEGQINFSETDEYKNIPMDDSFAKDIQKEFSIQSSQKTNIESHRQSRSDSIQTTESNDGSFEFIDAQTKSIFVHSEPSKESDEPSLNVGSSFEHFSTVTCSFDDIHFDSQSTKASDSTAKPASDVNVYSKSESVSSETTTHSNKFETVASVDEETYFYLEDSTEDSLAQDGRSLTSISEKSSSKQNEAAEPISIIKSTESEHLTSSISSISQKPNELAENHKSSEFSESHSSFIETKQSACDKIELDQKFSKTEITESNMSIDSQNNNQVINSGENNTISTSLASDSVQEKLVMKSTSNSGSIVVIEEISTTDYKPIASLVQPSSSVEPSSTSSTSVTEVTEVTQDNMQVSAVATVDHSESTFANIESQSETSGEVIKSQIIKTESSISRIDSTMPNKPDNQFDSGQDQKDVYSQSDSSLKFTNNKINEPSTVGSSFSGSDREHFQDKSQYQSYASHSGNYEEDEWIDDKLKSTFSSQSSVKVNSPTLSPLPAQSFDKLSRDIVDKGISLRTASEIASSIVHHETKVTNLNLPEVISEESGSKGDESDVESSGPDVSSPKFTTHEFLAKVETAPGTGTGTLATTFPTSVDMPSVHLRRSAQMAAQVLYEVPDEEDSIDSPLSERKQLGLARETTSSKEFPEVLHISEETTPSTPSETQSPKDAKELLTMVQSSSMTTTTTAATTSTSMEITSPPESKPGLCCFPRSIETDGAKKGKEEKPSSTSIGETISRVVTHSQNLTEQQKKEKEATLKEWGTPLGLPKPPEVSPADPKKATRSASKSRATSSDRTSDSRTYSNRYSASSSSDSSSKPIYLDLAYIPHHGDRHYCNIDYFKKIRARYYVLSGVNPSREVLEALVEGKRCWEDKSAEVTLIPSHETEALCLWMATNQQILESLNIDVAPSASRCSVILQDQESSCSAYRVEF